MTTSAHKRYARTIIMAGIIYAIILFSAISFIDKIPPGPWRYLVAILPVLPCLWGIWAVVRLVREVDEMWQKIYLEAATFSLGLTVALCFTWFFLYRLADAPHLELIWIPAFAMAAWGIGAARASRRYGADACGK